MAIRIEFYGIPRARAGVAETTATSGRLEEVLADLEQRFPGLAETCIEGGRFRRGFVANVGGRLFASDPDTHIQDGQTLLILSADAGG